MKTQKLDWKTQLEKYQRISGKLHLWAVKSRETRMKLAREMLCKAGLGPNGFLEAHNWGTSLPDPDKAMLCQRALKLSNDWTPIERCNQITAMAWNRYMVPAGAPKSQIPTY